MLLFLFETRLIPKNVIITGGNHATLQSQQKKLKGYESELEKMANEF